MDSKQSKIISWSDFPNLIKSGFNGTYVLFGDDDYIKESLFRQAYKKIMTAEGFEDMNYHNISFILDSDPLGKLDDSLSSLPMMQEQVLIRVQGYNFEKSNKTDLNTLSKLCSYSDEQYIIFISALDEELSYDRNFTNGSVYKELSKYATFINCEHPDRGKFCGWARKKALQEKCVLSEGAQNALYEMTNGDMQTAENEIGKLVSYSLTREDKYIVSEEDVKTLCTYALKEEVDFELNTAMGTWSINEVLSAVSNCRDRQEDPNAVLAKMENVLCDMFNVKTALISGVHLNEAATTLDMNRYRAEKISQTVGAPPISLIESAIEEAYKADVRMKSTSVDPWIILDEFIIKIYTPKNLR